MAYTRENWPQRLRAKATVEDKPKEQELMQDPKGGGSPSRYHTVAKYLLYATSWSISACGIVARPQSPEWVLARLGMELLCSHTHPATGGLLLHDQPVPGGDSHTVLRDKAEGKPADA